jgi:lambda family phage portal protein
MKRYGPSGERIYDAKPARGGKSWRTYAMAMGGRLTSNWRSVQSSADQELTWSLTRMRGRARELVRNAPYAKRAKMIVVNNVIGAGIGLQPNVINSRDRPLDDINDEIEDAFKLWCRADSCHTGGKLHFHDMERAAMGQIFDAGEVLIREHYQAFGASKVPFCLELIEPERLADEWTSPGPVGAGNQVRMGVEIDAFGRPQAYWLRQFHPGDVRFDASVIGRVERVPANQMFHLYVVDRWPQVRGEPWMHAAARRLNDMDGYSEAEIVAARGAASYMGFIKTPDENAIAPDSQEADQRQIQFEPGMMEQLPPGWDVVLNNPNRPNPGFSDFMRAMLREVAAGASVSYESLSRDYSQSNYSSARLALLDDRDLWRQLQQWFIRSFRERLHRDWLTAAVLARAVQKISVEDFAQAPEVFSAVKFKPRGWSWVDPTREISSYVEAVRSGFMTLSAVIAQTGDGKDLDDIIAERKGELADLKEAGILTDTEVAALTPTALKPGAVKEPDIGTPVPGAPPGFGDAPNKDGNSQSEDDDAVAGAAARGGRVLAMHRTEG